MPAAGTWSPDALAVRCGAAKMQLAHRAGAMFDHELKLQMTMADYVQYMRAQKDEMPLYVFDAKFAEKVPELLLDYDVPSLRLFQEDLFTLLGSSNRPDFRWLVVGPARTGAPWHIDPHRTSAWNALLHGRKRWALYPPRHHPPGILVKTDDAGYVVDFHAPMSAVQWYMDVYPTLSPDERPMEFVQSAGDVVFIPSGWWHMILNLDETVSVTQNFVSAANLDDVVADICAAAAQPGGQSDSGSPEREAAADWPSDYHGVPRASIVPLPLAEQLNAYQLLKECISRAHPALLPRVELAEGFQHDAQYLAEHWVRHAPAVERRRSDADLWRRIISYQSLQATFDDADLWRTPIGAAAKAAGLYRDRDHGHASALGSRKNAVFAWTAMDSGAPSAVIKIFGPSVFVDGGPYLAPGDAMLEWRTEAAVLRALAQSSDCPFGAPRLLGTANSTIAQTSKHRWAWPALAIGHLPGISLATAREAMNLDSVAHSLSLVVPWLAKASAWFHTSAQVRSAIQGVTLVGPDSSSPLETHAHAGVELSQRCRSVITASRRRALIDEPSRTWVAYTDRLRAMRATAVARRAHTRSLPGHLLAQLDSFLPPINRIEELLPPDWYMLPPAAVHGDLSVDNLLGSCDVAGAWTPHSVIDFADAFLGDPLVDFTAMFCSVCLCTPELLGTLFRLYDQQRAACAAESARSVVTVTSDLLMSPAERYRFFCLLLIHPVDGFGVIEEERPEVLQCATLHEAQERLLSGRPAQLGSDTALGARV